MDKYVPLPTSITLDGIQKTVERCLPHYTMLCCRSSVDPIKEGKGWIVAIMAIEAGEQGIRYRIHINRDDEHTYEYIKDPKEALDFYNNLFA